VMRAQQHTDQAAPAPARSVSRRAVVVGTAATAAAAAAVSVPLGASSAAAGTTSYLPPTRAYRRTHVPDAATRHLANRFTYGYTPELGREIRAAGGRHAWFERQLHPSRIPDHWADSFTSWFPSLSRSPREQFARVHAEPSYTFQGIADNARWTMLRRTYSNRQLHEVMTEFWENHLHIYSATHHVWVWRPGYDRLIRKHALGRFDEMLQSTTVHPAMLAYLTADLSFVFRTKSGQVIPEINENLGRELLELHTVGLGTGYTESMVQDSSRILTGWRIDHGGSETLSYDKQRHFTGPVRVLGFSAPNLALDGRPVLHDYLHYLAHHPATAQRIARKLAVRFVSDAPSAALVDHLASVFRSSGTDIKTTLRALVSHPEFKASPDRKVRTPTEDLSATLRVLRTQIHRPRRGTDAANAIYHVAQTAGQAPFAWPRPDGFPDSSAAWSSAGRLIGAYHMHYNFSGGWYPSTGVTYRSPQSWLPVRRIRFDRFVDHLCRLLHGRPSSRRLLGAACIVVDHSPGDIITRDSTLIRYQLSKLLGLLLDTEHHLTR
jgi:uncharacterized protein (DUF1800 family)